MSSRGKEANTSSMDAVNPHDIVSYDIIKLVIKILDHRKLIPNFHVINKMGKPNKLLVYFY